MSENFTRSEGLVKEIPIKGWLAGPEGQQGFAVVVLRKTKHGTRYYRTLDPGESLDLGERVLSDFIALTVDLRIGRYFTINQNFDVYERGLSVRIEAKVRYRVTDVDNIALNHIDPLGELRDKVIATLTRELSMHREASIRPKTIEELIRSVGALPQLGLMVEDAEIIKFKGDDAVLGTLQKDQNWAYTYEQEQKKLEAELEARRRRTEAELKEKRLRAQVDREIHEADSLSALHLDQTRISSINLMDINALMHQYPKLIPQIFDTFSERDRKMLDMKMGLVAQSVSAYIEDQSAVKGEVDPNKIAEIMRSFLPDQSRSQKLLANDILFEDDEPTSTGNVIDDDIEFDDE